MKQIKIAEAFSTIRNGVSIKQDKEIDGIPITRIETIADGFIDLHRLGYASIKGDIFENYYLKDGDILMSHINSISHLGKVAIFEDRNEQIIHGMNLLCLKTIPEILLPRYAFLYFKSKQFRSSIKKITKRSVNQASFNISDLKDLEIPIHSLSDQLHIANILTKAESLISLRKESIRLLDEYLKSTFLEMFGDQVRNEKGWERRKLKDVCARITDGTHFSPPIQKEGIPYITAKHVRENKIDFFSTPWFISEEDHKDIYKRCDPKKGDVLYIKDGATTGYAAINKYEFEFSMLSSLALLKPNKTICSSEYICAWLNNPVVKSRILLGMSGGAIQRLTLTKLNELPINLPDIQSQKVFAQIVERTEILKTHYQQSLLELENLYGSLSQKAFKGELNFKDEKVMMAAEPGYEVWL
jgi:type I restriction enzyme, S subunit